MDMNALNNASLLTCGTWAYQLLCFWEIYPFSEQGLGIE